MKRTFFGKVDGAAALQGIKAMIEAIRNAPSVAIIEYETGDHSTEVDSIKVVASGASGRTGIVTYKLTEHYIAVSGRKVAHGLTSTQYFDLLNMVEIAKNEREAFTGDVGHDLLAELSKELNA